MFVQVAVQRIHSFGVVRATPSSSNSNSIAYDAQVYKLNFSQHQVKTGRRDTAVLYGFALEICNVNIVYRQNIHVADVLSTR